MINLNLGDSLDAMRQMPDKAYSLAIVDPPYGINYEKAGGFNAKAGFIQFERKGWDKRPPEKDYFDELFRVSKNQIIWGGNYFSKFLPASMGWVFWDKMQHNFSFSDGELAFSSFKRKLKVFQRNTGVDNGHDGGRIHPTQKPVALYKWLLKNYAKPGDKILDTHLGSASIALACHDMGFDLDGFEIDEDYYTNAVKRLESHQRQMQLFQPSQLAYP